MSFFEFWIIVVVKSISRIKGGYAMWFSPVNCSRGCSSLSCDNSVRSAIVHATTTYHTKMAQRVPGTTNFIISTKHLIKDRYIFNGEI